MIAVVETSRAEAPEEPSMLRVAQDEAPFLAPLPPYCYWIRWNERPVFVIDIAGITVEEADRRNHGAAAVLEAHPEWRMPILLWVRGTPPPAPQSEPALRRLSAATDRIGDRQAVAGLSNLQYLALRILNRFRRSTVMPFTGLAQALEYLAPAPKFR